MKRSNRDATDVIHPYLLARYVHPSLYDAVASSEADIETANPCPRRPKAPEVGMQCVNIPMSPIKVLVWAIENLNKLGDFAFLTVRNLNGCYIALHILHNIKMLKKQCVYIGPSKEGRKWLKPLSRFAVFLTKMNRAGVFYAIMIREKPRKT